MRAEFAGEFDDRSLESLLLRIRHPQKLSRDELTVVIEDSDLADAMVSVAELYFRPDGVLYFEPPNGTTPAFRMYRRGGFLRVEFDARSF